MGKVTRGFEQLVRNPAIFETDGFHVIHTPHQVPNAYANHWVRSVREVGLDLLLILNVIHLRSVLVEQIDE